MSEVSKSLIVSFDALNLVKGIKSIGGPDKQVFYIESNLYAPDRRITPLILQPYILVEDPHEIISSGDKVGELSSAEWYFDEIKSENRITAKEENASIDTPFALSANNSLHIRKNVEKAIQLFFEAEYLDTRKNKNIHISLTYLLSTTQSSEVKPAPKLKLSKPQSWKYCPLDKATEATIEAEVFANNKGYKSAVEWCKVEGDKVIPLTNEAFVLGGQNTDKLKVNPHVMGDSLIRARNVSEEAYNKAYGINPEWDGRMREVFENRNLFSNQSLIIDGYVGYDTEILPSSQLIIGVSNRKSIVIPIVEGKPYSISYKEVATAKRFSFGFYESYNKNYDTALGEIGHFNWSDHSSKVFNNYIAPPTSKYLIIYFGFVVYDLPTDLKIEQNSKATPYTPAPEDLNWENLVRYGGKYEMKDSPTNTIALEMPIYPNTNTFRDIQLCFRVENTTNPTDYLTATVWQGGKPVSNKASLKYKVGDMVYINLTTNSSYNNNAIANFLVYHGEAQMGVSSLISSVFMHFTHLRLPFQLSPYALAPDGIIKGDYEADIKFTKYFPEINAEILFLTGDSIRPEHKTVKAQAVFTTNKEPIKNPSEFFDIEWFIDPIEAGGAVKKIGTGEFMEIPVSDLQLKGGRLVPIRLKYNFK